MLKMSLNPVAVSLLALVISPVIAETVEQQDLPEARALIERHITAIGGREAVLVQAEAVLTGEFSLPAMGITGSLTVASRPPADQVVLIDLPGMGEMRTGVSPELAWSVDPFMGPRLIEGDELKSLLDSTLPGAVLRDPEYVAAATTVGMAEFLGKDCYLVRLDWRSGRESHDCYAVDSGLLIAMQSVESSPMGEVQVVSTMEDFRQIEGVMMATVVRQTIMGMEQVMHLHDIRFEAPDAELFELPPPIQTLVEDR